MQIVWDSVDQLLRVSVPWDILRRENVLQSNQYSFSYEYFFLCYSVDWKAHKLSIEIFLLHRWYIICIIFWIQHKSVSGVWRMIVCTDDTWAYHNLSHTGHNSMTKNSIINWSLSINLLLKFIGVTCHSTINWSNEKLLGIVIQNKCKKGMQVCCKNFISVEIHHSSV